MGDLKGGEIFTYDEPVKEVKNKDLESAIQKEIEGSTVSFRDELDIVMDRAANLEDAGSVVNNGTYESYISVNEGYADKIKIIGEIKIEVKDNDDSEEEEAINSDLDKTPFLLLISGIDTRPGTMPTRSLSDVNILAAVNPKTKNITLTAIPRDMYVQLHGTTGLRDKLTHAGAQGGVELTKSTIEDFIGLKIDRYIRVNFNFVTDLVDNIGGITVTNDLDRTLKLDGCVYQPGDNAVDGKCALRFARERKSYTTGDRHRGENQEQVITKIVDKISHDKAIIADSGKILNVMNGSFNTNISSDDIKALIKMQLSDMSSWKTESYNINGSGSLTKTFSYPNQNLYVMIPDENTIATAKEKLSKTLEK
jgi:LCP family protein required for cell wall assembly